MSIDEDYFIPVRGDASSRVESLPGGTYTGDIDDVKYLRDKLFSALKIPPSYLSQVEGAEEDKTTLAQKDVRFARTIQRLQRSVVTELEKIGVIHLYVLGFRGNDLTSYKLSLANPSKIAELQELEHWKVKFDTASGATEGYFSKRWIATHLFNMSEDEFIRNQREMFFDRKLEATLEATAESAQAEISSGMPGLDDELGGGAGEMADLEDPGGTGTVGPEAELGAEEPAGGGEESALLAAPGKRDDSNEAVSADSRGRTKADRNKEYLKTRKGKNDMRPAGAHRRRDGAAAGNSLASSSRRNTMKGYHELTGLYKSRKTNYLQEENNIEQISEDIRRLIEGLEMRGKNETETQ